MIDHHISEILDLKIFTETTRLENIQYSPLRWIRFLSVL